MGEGDQGDLVKVEPTDLAVVADDGDPKIIRLQEDLEVKRQRLVASFESLQEEIEEAVDWHGWVRENPWKTVGFAFAVGFLFGSG